MRQAGTASSTRFRCLEASNSTTGALEGQLLAASVTVAESESGGDTLYGPRLAALIPGQEGCPLAVVEEASLADMPVQGCHCWARFLGSESSALGVVTNSVSLRMAYTFL